MSAPAFTPGPWHIFEYENGRSDTDLCMIGDEGRRAMTLECVPKINANLIAASPCLYEALADFERSAALIGNTSSAIAPTEIARQGAEAWSRCITTARAALAKARGE